MRKCPDCNLIQYPDNIEKCLICGARLVVSGPSILDYETILLSIDFTMISCDGCNANFPYTINSLTCGNCGHAFTNDDGSPLVFEDVDPIITQRRKILQTLENFRQSAQIELENLSSPTTEPSEDDYRLKFIENSSEYARRAILSSG